MADLAITGVTLLETNPTQTIEIGETVAAFDVVYRAADGKHFKADALDAAKAAAVFFVLTGGDAGQFVTAIPVSATGLIRLVGPTLVQAGRYVVSATAGKIAPRADLLTGHYLTELFVATNANDFRFDVNATGVTVP